MERRGVFSLLILFLLIAVAVATEAESFRQNQVGGTNEQDATLRAASALTTVGANATTTTNILSESIDAQERPLYSEEDEREGDTAEEKEDEDQGEGEQEYEGEEEDEYEDELKAVAESHEAMSKDDTRNANITSSVAAPPVAVERTGAKSFDSHEVMTVNDSDEDVASNEAITDEVLDKYDEEVSELLKYKKEKNLNYQVDNKTKTKRVPTVKKELSTQKEILIGSNETQVPKSLVPSEEDTLNRLNEKTETIRRRNVEINGPTKMERNQRAHTERSSGDAEVAVNNRYTGSHAENRKKLDKRQETILNDLRSYLLAEYETEEEERQKLHELGAQEDALAENLLKLLVKLAENPSRWERVQKLLVNLKSELKFPRDNALDPTKRGYGASTLFVTTPRSVGESRKSRKKLKKKKKKPRHRFSTTTTMSSVPVTPPLLTTTEIPWQTTPVQWRLVAERLFGPPWQRDLQEESENVPKVRYSVASKARTLPSIRDLIEQNKSRSSLKSFGAERKTLLGDSSRDLGSERLFRFGKVNTHQPAHLQGHREFGNVYDRSAEPDRLPSYEVPESYQHLRYNQLSPPSGEYLRRNDDYQNDYAIQGNNFAYNHEYDPSGNEFAMSKAWPDASYQYNRPWKTEDRSLLPVSSGKWPWTQPQTDMNYWSQRNKFLQPEKNYWTTLSNEDELERAESDKVWQREEQLPPRPWERDRLNTWPVDKSLKIPPWPQTERSIKLYERDQSNTMWDKNKNRSELNKSSMKEDKEKVVLPQITMKTWNSLTSDPATWPYKLPGAKPWPKDENGKSYNPNADLVKKLGLDKQDNSWSKEDVDKLNIGRKLKIDKQSRLISSNESTKPEGFPREVSKYRSSSEKSNLNDYKTRASEPIKPAWSMMLPQKSPKDWTKSHDSDTLQNDDASAWRKKYEARKSSWQSEDSLPRIQSLGAWVMAPDQSTWKPYPIKPIETIDENSPNPRRWSSNRPSSNEHKWPSKEGSWSVKMKEPWRERPNVPSWPGKSSKSNSWYSKTKEGESWTPKSSNVDSWKSKDNPSWLNKPNESTSWSSKIVDKSTWTTKDNRSPWSRKYNESWVPKGQDDMVKFTNEDSWSTKIKDDAWTSKSDVSWKNNEGNSWPRKADDHSSWNTKGNDLGTWQQKINDDWSYGKGGSTGTWPSRWKQFAYHRVTAMPISKPGTTADATSSKSKNAFVAVSAVSSPKYTGSEWRKNEDEQRNENTRGDDQDRTNNQLQVGLERPIYAWKKDPNLLASSSTKVNGTDPLENQLEALRQIDFWPYKENEAEKGSSTTSPAETTSTAPTNSTTATYRQNGIASKDNDRLLDTNQQTISMK